MLGQEGGQDHRSWRRDFIVRSRYMSMKVGDDASRVTAVTDGDLIFADTSVCRFFNVFVVGITRRVSQGDDQAQPVNILSIPAGLCISAQLKLHHLPRAVDAAQEAAKVGSHRDHRSRHYLDGQAVGR